jgi:hypothetical protein
MWLLHFGRALASFDRSPGCGLCARSNVTVKVLDVQ